MSSWLPPPRRSTRIVTLVISVVLVALLAYLTLWPTRVEDRAPALLDVVLSTARDTFGWTWLTFERLEVLTNVAVFIPVGACAFLLLPRRAWPASLLVGPTLSALIEITQAMALPERTATTSDVVANSAGATLGVGLALIATLLRHPRIAPDRSPRLDAP